jgi:hypothetical protein
LADILAATRVQLGEDPQAMGIGQSTQTRKKLIPSRTHFAYLSFICQIKLTYERQAVKTPNFAAIPARFVVSTYLSFSAVASLDIALLIEACFENSCQLLRSWWMWMALL